MGDEIGDSVGARSRFRRPPRPLTGQLLLATPALDDPNFERSVVLILSHDRAGAYGVILNRATEMDVCDVLGGWDHKVATPGVVFEGGPVEPESAICLARLRPGAKVRDFQSVDGVVGTLDVVPDAEEEDPHLVRNVEGIRVFCGYAGWGAGQLRREIAEGSWLVVDALPGDAFAPLPDDLWQVVLRRQGGMLSALAHYPPNPVLN